MTRHTLLITGLRGWFLVSVLIGAFLLGWYFQKEGYAVGDAVLYGMTIVGLVFLFSMSARRYLPKLGALVLFVAAALVFGSSLVTQKLWLNDWLNGSLQEALAYLSVSEPGRDENEGTPLTVKPVSYLKEVTVDLDGLGTPLLVAFDGARQRLALFEEDAEEQVSILRGDDLNQVIDMQADGSMILTYDNTIMSRAKLEDGILYERWRRQHFDVYWHHWGQVFEDRFYQPGRQFVDLPNEDSRRFGRPYSECERKNGFVDVVHAFDYATGELVKTYNVPDAIAGMDNEEHKRLIVGYMENCRDPLHLNSVEMIENEREASYFPNGEVGDILVSLRDVHALLLLDRETSEVVWSVVGGDNGLYKRQHSPFISDRGTVVLFDNKGSDKANGVSRITEVNIATGERMGFYEARGEEFFQSGVRGKVREMADGRLLVSQEKNKYLPVPEGKPHMAVFTLDCPRGYISLDCTRDDLLTSELKQNVLHNAVVLEETE